MEIGVSAGDGHSVRPLRAVCVRMLHGQGFLTCAPGCAPGAGAQCESGGEGRGHCAGCWDIGVLGLRSHRAHVGHGLRNSAAVRSSVDCFGMWSVLHQKMGTKITTCVVEAIHVKAGSFFCCPVVKLHHHAAHCGR